MTDELIDRESAAREMERCFREGINPEKWPDHIRALPAVDTSALAADNARMAKRVEDARGAMAHVMEWNWIDLAIYIDENGADQAQLDFPYTMKDRAEILAFLAGGDA